MNNYDNLFIEKYRPKTLNDIVLSKEDREFFESLATKQEIPHLLFAGVQGSGKTSLSKIIINDILKCEYLYLNASDETGIDAIRSKVIGFARTKSFDGKIKIVLLDEADSISFEAMKCLRNVQEEFSATCRFIMTCNYLHKIIPALQSRCQIISLNPPLEETVKRVVSILKKENIVIPDEQKPLLLKHIKANLPDLRRIIGDIQKYSVTGTLQIRSDVSSEFAHKVFKMLCNKQDLMAIRKEIIENEKAFSNDYHNLLKQLFELVFESDLPSEKKTDCMLVISKGMELHNMIVDKEINCFTALINLHRTI
jgi:DNA polymerase III delta prime subunit